MNKLQKISNQPNYDSKARPSQILSNKNKKTSDILNVRRNCADLLIKPTYERNK